MKDLVIGDRVTIIRVAEDASPWMVGQPGTVMRTRDTYGNYGGRYDGGPQVKFDPLPDDAINHRARNTDSYYLATTTGWWVHADIVVPLKPPTTTSHEVW